MYADRERRILGNREPKELGSRTGNHARMGGAESSNRLLQVLGEEGETALTAGNAVFPLICEFSPYTDIAHRLSSLSLFLIILNST